LGESYKNYVNNGEKGQVEGSFLHCGRLAIRSKGDGEIKRIESGCQREIRKKKLPSRGIGENHVTIVIEQRKHSTPRKEDNIKGEEKPNS